MNSQFWDERYRAAGYAYGRAPNEFLRTESWRIPPGPVLCIAEGEGRNAVYLAGLGHDVTAVDFSAEGLRKAELLAREHDVTIKTVNSDLATYEPPAAGFMGIVAIFAHLPPPIRRRVHSWVPRALRPGGVFLLEAYSPQQLAFNTGGPRDAALLMTLADLKAELAPLTIEVGREREREFHEGTFHSGPGATVQVIAARSAP